MKWLDLLIDAAFLVVCSSAAWWGLQQIKPGLGWAAAGVGGLVLYWRVRRHG